MYQASNIANYFLQLAHGSSDGSDVTNLKLQKLLYYAQGFYLAVYDKPLFEEQIEAWEYGPVVPEIYHSFKTSGADILPKPERTENLDYDASELLSEVFAVYGQFAPWRLVELTHSEPPWKSAFKGSGIISGDSMRSYFKTQLIDDGEE